LAVQKSKNTKRFYKHVNNLLFKKGLLLSKSYNIITKLKIDNSYKIL